MANKAISDIILQAGDGSGYYRRKLQAGTTVALAADALTLRDGGGSFVFPRADYVAPPPPPAPPPGQPDTLVVSLSEDAFGGDAQFSVSLDGVPLGPPAFATASHQAAATQAFTFQAAVSDGRTHTLGVSLLNDAYDPSTTPPGDRNLYLDSVTLNGAPVPGGSAAILTNATVNVPVGAGPLAPMQAPPPPAYVSSMRRTPVPLTALASDQVLLECGPGKPFAGPGPALERANADPGKRYVIRVDPGTYVGDLAAPRHNYISATDVVLECSDPTRTFRVTMDPGGLYSAKGLLIPCVGGRFEFRNMEAFGIQNPNRGTRGNWGAIVPEAGVADTMLVLVLGCLIYECNNGLCRGGPGTEWTITGSAVRRCGLFGEGYSHNLYLLGRKAVATDLDSAEAVDGHEIKSRCGETTIIGGSYCDGPAGTASYRIDLPDGGRCLVRGALVQNGPKATNAVGLHFGGEDPAAFHAGSSLAVEGCTFVNERYAGVAVRNDRPDAVTATMAGNKVWGFDGDKVFVDGRGTACPDAALVALQANPLA